jgi:hypothetical protein
MNSGMMTVRAISLEWNDSIRRGDSPPLWRLGDLIDDFRQRASGPAEKMALVTDPPEWVANPAHADCDAYWAAVVETLCREAGLPPPEWTESSRCYLHTPWFAGSMENLKAILLAESPVAFRRRNLFVSGNAMSRV